MALFGKKRERLSDEDLLAEDEVVETSVRPEPADGEPGVDREWDRAGDGPYDITGDSRAIYWTNRWGGQVMTLAK